MTTVDVQNLSADVAIVGSGFGGSLTALALRRLGRSVVLLERGRHPRFAIGESSTPLANLLLEEICDRYDLERIRPLSKWGTWQRTYPEVVGGLKRGFSFFHHHFDREFQDSDQHEQQLLVAASPHDGVGDTHWYRPDVDQFLVREAQNAAADYVDEVELNAFHTNGKTAILEGERRGRSVQVTARFVIDASGPRGFLHRALRLPERAFTWLPPTQALFSHFTDVERWGDTVSIDGGGAPPFAVDDAALHHVFPGGWIWILRFNNGITSAGAALTDSVSAAIDIQAEGAWNRLLGRLPSISDQFRGARPTRAVIHSSRLAFRSNAVSGANWVLLPSAAGVIDPLLSTGFPLTLLGIQRLVRLLEADRWNTREFADGLSDYSRRTLRELDATEQLVAALYASMNDFELFKRLSLLYFAAASFSETVRRLGRAHKSMGFLLCDDPVFGAETRACTAAALAPPTQQDRPALFDRIDRAIAPIDVAGLGDRERRDWYPAAARDLIEGASKLEATASDVERLLARCGFAVFLIALCLCAACHRSPAPSGEAYRQAVVSFYTGLAALQTSQEVLAREQFDRVIAVAPNEPAAWADLGLLLLRQQDLDEAAERLTKAAQLAPDNGDIQRLLGLTESRRGNLPQAIGHWQRALQLRSDDVKAAYALALDQERSGTSDDLANAQRTLESLAQRTRNLVVQLDYARLAAKRGDIQALQRAVEALAQSAPTWPDDVRERLRTVQQSAAADPRSAGQNIAFLKNVAMRLPEYRLAYGAVSTPQSEVGEPIDRLLALANPPSQPAPLDDSIAFNVEQQRAFPGGTALWVGPLSLSEDRQPIIAAFDGRNIQLPAGSVSVSATRPDGVATSPRRNSVLVADLNYDFLSDLVVSGAQGLVLLRQQPNGTFVNVTARSHLAPAVLAAPASGLWAADYDLDGDLDVVEALPEGALQVLRNNGDETFTVERPFGGAADVRGFVWADLDGDGVPDGAALDRTGTTRIYLNGRGGTFRENRLPAVVPKAVAINAAEVTGDSILDLVELTAEGAVISLSRADDGSGWTSSELARAPEPPAGLTIDNADLLFADLDNNGAADIVMASPSGSRVLLRGAEKRVQPLAARVPVDVRSTVDLDGDGRLELVGVASNGEVSVARSHGTSRYHWQTIRPRAATATGDQRINSFGIGGEVEVRTGLHVQKQLIAGPAVHLGLGAADRSDVIRISWPNGVLQSEFNAAADAAIPATQRLKGSCPWLFAWNGRDMSFVTDVLWRSPLGLRINAQTTADVVATEDWVRVRGDQLAPTNGFYDLRITAELWETHFFDLASLLIVDHPANTEVFVDERFSVPPPKTGVTVTGPVQRLAAATDDRGANVAAVVQERDDRYLDIGDRGPYQGIGADHFVEIEIPESAPRTGPLWLIAQGWIHPTDSSINVAIGQGMHALPRGLSLEVADESGRFRLARTNLGFPAGKYKTMLIDLQGVFSTAGRRRARLATNMEIFWDRLGWAVGRPDVATAPVRLVPAAAELRYRGYSRTEQADSRSPERPSYFVEGTSPRWRDLEGYYTRFGDVRELLLAVDDRYVIMNAGDELRVRFPEQKKAAPGTVRDYVMITDGWEKDGDFNTTFSRTVLPLPTHDHPRYDRWPGRLEDDPVYLQHAQDFAQYHTRYLGPEPVRDALRQRQPPNP